MNLNIYEIEFTAINQRDKINIADYRGKLILVVNTASLCGFTKQYAEIEELWKKYKDSGLVVIAIPSNDFGNQEPGVDSEIARFCSVNFNTSFILTAKTQVKGDNAHLFFKWVRANYGWLASPKWNFYKFLIGTGGEPLAWFSSLTSPTSRRILNIIDKNLPQK